VCSLCFAPPPPPPRLTRVASQAPKREG